MAVETIIEDDRWSGTGIAALAERAVTAALSHVGLDPEEWDVAVLACDDARIAGLNEAFRGRRAATNVLSWPAEERGAATEGAPPALPEPGGDPELGDIAIAWETTRHEAEAAGLTMDAHVLHLLVHAALHLLGYDHVRDGDGDLMEAEETAILARLGVADPYGDGDRAL